MSNQNNNRPKIAAFVCNWCSYAGADAAGTSRLQYDDSVRIIRLPCTGRIDPLFVVKAFEQGADGVLVSGCHPGDCHYVSGNLYARRRFVVFKKLMDFLGLDERRLQFSWVSAAEGAKWADVVNAVSQGVKEVQAEDFRWGEQSRNGEKNQPQIQNSKLQIVNPQSAIEESTTAQLRSIARRLLENRQVGVVIGYAQGSLPNTTTPFFATKPDDTDQLVWNCHCHNNLSVYLTKKLVRTLGRIALVAKGCDVKSIVGLIQENQIKREDVVIIGVQCDGVELNERLAGKCHACAVRTPPLYDELVGQQTNQHQTQSDPLDEEIRQIEQMDREARWNYWQQQFARCIRCYACRAVCPLCYCETCITDKHRPQWIPTSAHGKGNLAWNIIRALHLAGRCVGCDECTRVCPAGIRLDLINRKLAQVIKQEFGYETGLSPETAPPLATYTPEDKGEFIR
jgi:coenzyme F420-reducing hydrogenase delta subunit/ferredoxin